MDLHFSGELWYWRGPAPFHFVTVPDEESASIAAVAPLVTYGWGTLPVKKVLREAERLELGDIVEIGLHLEPRSA